MMRHKACEIALIGLVLSGCATTRAPAGWQGDFSADAVITRAIAAQGSGGVETTRASGSSIKGTFRVQRRIDGVLVEETQRLYMIAPETWAMHISGAGDDHVYLCSGGQCSELRNDVVVRSGVAIGETGVDRLLRGLFLLRWLRHDTDARARVDGTMAGEDGGDWIRIAKPDADGQECVAILDAATLRPCGLTQSALIDGRRFSLDTRYGSFANDDLGNAYPTEIVSTGSDGFEEIVRVVELRRRDGMDPRRFRLP